MSHTAIVITINFEILATFLEYITDYFKVWLLTNLKWPPWLI